MKQMNAHAPRHLAPLAALLLSAVAVALPHPARADDVSSAQRRAAAEYLDAVASGSAQAMAYAIHPNELDRLRTGILARLRQENSAGDNTLRARLFGQLASLQDVERMTSMNFFQAIARRKGQSAEAIIAWLSSVPPMMPDHHLTQDERLLLARFILSLRD